MLMARRRAGDISIVVRQTGRQPRHKAARTKELRRCTIRARDGRMRIERDRGWNSKTADVLRRCWRDSRESIPGYEGRKEGRKVLYRDAAWDARVATRVGKGEVAFSV